MWTLDSEFVFVFVFEAVGLWSDVFPSVRRCDSQMVNRLSMIHSYCPSPACLFICLILMWLQSASLEYQQNNSQCRGSIARYFFLNVLRHRESKRKRSVLDIYGSEVSEVFLKRLMMKLSNNGISSLESNSCVRVFRCAGFLGNSFHFVLHTMILNRWA